MIAKHDTQSKHCRLYIQNAVEINDYMDPADQLQPAADAEDGRHGNDQPQYAQLMPTRGSGPRRGRVSRRPYAAADALYAAIDHNLLKQTVVVVVDDEPWLTRDFQRNFTPKNKF